MGALFFPLLRSNFQKKFAPEQIYVEADGEKINLTQVLSRKVNIYQGDVNKNKVLITDGNGNVTVVIGVVMQQSERDQLKKLNPGTATDLDNDRINVRIDPATLAIDSNNRITVIDPANTSHTHKIKDVEQLQSELDNRILIYQPDHPGKMLVVDNETKNITFADLPDGVDITNILTEGVHIATINDTKVYAPNPGVALSMDAHNNVNVKYDNRTIILDAMGRLSAVQFDPSEINSNIENIRTKLTEIERDTTKKVSKFFTSITELQIGEIGEYQGETNETFVRGYFYERGTGGPVTVPVENEMEEFFISYSTGGIVEKYYLPNYDAISDAIVTYETTNNCILFSYHVGDTDYFVLLLPYSLDVANGIEVDSSSMAFPASHNNQITYNYGWLCPFAFTNDGYYRPTDIPVDYIDGNVVFFVNGEAIIGRRYGNGFLSTPKLYTAFFYDGNVIYKALLIKSSEHFYDFAVPYSSNGIINAAAARCTHLIFQERISSWIPIENGQTVMTYVADTMDSPAIIRVDTQPAAAFDTYSIETVSTTEGFLKTYQLVKTEPNGSKTYLPGKIDITKDLFLNAVERVTVNAQNPVEQNGDYLPHGDYFRFDFNTDNGISSQYIPIDTLRAEMTAGSHITIDGTEISASGFIPQYADLSNALPGENIVQYVGQPGNGLMTGCFYKRDGNSWKQMDVQPHKTIAHTHLLSEIYDGEDSLATATESDITALAESSASGEPVPPDFNIQLTYATNEDIINIFPDLDDYTDDNDAVVASDSDIDGVFGN